MSTDLPYLRSYPASLQDQARDLLQQGKLGAVLLRKYPQAHAVRSDKALYVYIDECLDAVRGTPAQFGAFIQSEMGRWAKVAQAAGVQPE